MNASWMSALAGQRRPNLRAISFRNEPDPKLVCFSLPKRLGSTPHCSRILKAGSRSFEPSISQVHGRTLLKLGPCAVRFMQQERISVRKRTHPPLLAGFLLFQPLRWLLRSWRCASNV